MGYSCPNAAWCHEFLHWSAKKKNRDDKHLSPFFFQIVVLFMSIHVISEYLPNTSTKRVFSWFVTCFCTDMQKPGNVKSTHPRFFQSWRFLCPSTPNPNIFRTQASSNTGRNGYFLQISLNISEQRRYIVSLQVSWYWCTWLSCFLELFQCDQTFSLCGAHSPLR